MHAFPQEKSSLQLLLQSFFHFRILSFLFAGLTAIVLLTSLHHVPRRTDTFSDTSSHSTLPSLLSSSPSSSSITPSSPSPASNATLGFQKILMIIMPHRSILLDYASLISDATSMQLTIQDGVDPSTIVPQALPPGSWSGYKPGELGCWRAHANALRRVVDEGLETALIMEGDNDWDVRVKDQMEMISERFPGRTEEKPYGTGWDMLYLGHCLTGNDEKGSREPIATWRDETVKDRAEMDSWMTEDLDYWNVTEEKTRFLIPSWSPICLSSYAITLAGARKLLYEMSINALNEPIDVLYPRLLQSGRITGYQVMPPIMGQYKTKSGRDSDIHKDEMGEGPVRDGPGVVRSSLDGGDPPNAVMREWSVRRTVGATVYGEGVVEEEGR